jgi:hypothetical protein
MKTINHMLMIAVVMTMLMLCAGVAMANPVVDLGSATGNSCDQVTVPVTLTNDPPLEVAAVSMDIGYNSTYLTPITATIGPAGQAAAKNIVKNIVSPGLYRIGVFSSSDLNPIGDGIVANVTFEIACDAPADTYVLTNKPGAATPAGIDVPTDGSDGSIQVGGSNTTTTSGSSTTTTTAVQPTTTTTSGSSTTTTTAVQPITTTTSVRPTTTTTAAQPTTTSLPTTTTVPPKSHIDICITCHVVSNLHAQPAHSNCSVCHDGAPGKGNVTADKCVVCHPTGNPGKCNLVNSHGSSCLDCHVKCAEGSTTTTIIVPPPSSYTLSVYPSSVKVSWFFPRPFVKLTISGTNVNFDAPTTVEIEGVHPIKRIEHMSSNVIIVRAWLPPKALIGKGVKLVTVQAGVQSYVGGFEIE